MPISATSTEDACAVVADACSRLGERYRAVRRQTEELCATLVTEDYVIQSMPDVSPTKWHLAHTSWFFETFVLASHVSGYQPFHPQFGYLFNSYYVAVGPRHCRPRRGLLSRPTVDEVYAYRQYVDEHMLELMEASERPYLQAPSASEGVSVRPVLSASEGVAAEIGPVIELGLHHEQQHQELLLTDIKHVFSANPLHPVFRNQPESGASSSEPAEWLAYPEGIYRIGHEGAVFAFDNERPRHRVFVDRFELSSRPVTNGEYLAFMADGGYQRPELWLSEGWNAVQTEGWQAPLYWERDGAEWRVMTLAGLRAVNEAEPVCHVSYFEADAFARWAGARLPSEAEWEIASEGVAPAGNLLDSGRFHPIAVSEWRGHDPAAMQGGTLAPMQMFGDVWEWTRSAYLPYPGYRPLGGALGEYNAKFMSSQMVLRGGSCATPASHIRRTYRNFFPPGARWQFMGLRLARDA